MGISLEKTNPTFRRLVAEATGDRRDNHANNARLQTAVAKPGASATLDNRKEGKGSGAAGGRTGRRYRVEYLIYSCSPMDWENAAFSTKFATDELVRQGWLPDGDGWRELEGTATAIKCAHRHEERTVVILRRIV